MTTKLYGYVLNQIPTSTAFALAALSAMQLQTEWELERKVGKLQQGSTSERGKHILKPAPMAPKIQIPLQVEKHRSKPVAHVEEAAPISAGFSLL